ncbi:hypothetical protein JVT61DRAFT_11014 [Boletus reticuloceps]|uniref:Uncharacterized protein n=1 Tax=Boletus reticuloceps TaxID=495285 RepID=A0A8I3A507_9AGAM|nr:hypothetical protein JVT61DRAFT_11014 [Boletus reticuloceps]
MSTRATKRTSLQGDCEELRQQLHVFRKTDPDRTDVLHLMILMVHCVTDENRIFARCLLDTLARGGAPACPGSVGGELGDGDTLDLGHGHPRSLSPAMRLRYFNEERQCVVTTSLTPTQIAAVIAHCRLNAITFRNAYLALTQVAMARVLYRRYLRGKNSEEKWTYPKGQPQINGGPLSLHRYLDKAWFENGGGEFILCINLYIYQHPFMTLGSATGQYKYVLLDGAPPFSELLTFDQFLHRSRLVKK